MSGKLNDFFEIVTGGTPPKSDPEMFGDYMPLVKPPELNDREVSRSTDNLSRAGASSSRVLPTGSVLVSCIGNLGKLGIAAVPLATNQQINAIKPNEKVALPQYVFYWARSPIFSESLCSKASGTTVPIVNKSKFSSIEIALPPLPEQKRIVAILDEAFAGIDTAVANTEKNLANARELFESYLNAVFSQRGEGWTLRALDELCLIARGGSPRPIKAFLTDDDEGVNWVKISDATASSKYIYETKQKIKPEGIRRSRMVHEGDLLLSNSMSFGRPYIMKTSGCIHDGWLVLSDKSGLYDQEYLYHYLGSADAYRQFDSRASGSTVRNLNIDLVRTVKAPLPSLDMQREIVRSLEDLGAECSRLDSIYSNKLDSLAELKQSLLQKAFSGELTAVPQDEIEDALA